jgi:beta-lactam-binding protein with PASTA domain
VATVPQLVGLRLAAAITRLAHSRCRLGTVTKRHARPALVGRVIAQQPEAGQYVDPGQKIKLVVGKR